MTPPEPEGVTDRPADVWEPLLAVADAAGGHWPERGRAACVELLAAAREDEQASIGVKLLTDLRDHVFHQGQIDRMATAGVLKSLFAIEDAPWSDMDGNGKALTARGLSKLLGEYVTSANKPIKPRPIRTSSGVPRGYYAEDLADAWHRYCPPLSGTSATSATPQVNSDESVADLADVADELPGIRYLHGEPTTTTPRTA